MRTKGFLGALVFSVVVLFGYGAVNAQIPDKVKDAAGKAKDVTVDAAKKTAEVTTDAAKKTADVTTDAAKKTRVVVTDGLDDAADKTAEVTVDTTKAAASKTKSFGSHAVTVTENVAGEVKEGGRWLTVTTWDGTKWVAKKVWYPAKKAASATKDAVQ